MVQSRLNRQQPVQREPLLSPLEDNKRCHESLQHWFRTYCLTKRLCLPSKAAILILLWTALVGVVYQQLRSTAVALIDNSEHNASHYNSLCYAVLALVMVFYPLSGFVADIYCGRCKCIIFSLWIFLIALLIASIGIVLIFLTDKHIHVFPPFHFKTIFLNSLIIPVVIIEFLSFPLFLIGLAGYEANFIQLELDQLLEAPSEYLGLFVHWANWAYHALALVVVMLFSVAICYSEQYRFVMETMTLYSSPILYLLILLVVLLVSCFKRHLFYPELRQHNPYNMVLNVLNYVRKNKYPRRRSAFTFSDHFIPSRMDFAKKRFGGPFRSEEVEDVKTLFRILLILLTLVPVHFLQVPASLFVFPLLGHHAGLRTKVSATHCTVAWMLFENGSMLSITSTCCFPIYIWVIFSLLQRRIPKIFTRLKFGIVLFLLGIFSMLIIDIAGHIVTPNDTFNGTAVSHFSCVFHGNFTSYRNTYNSLKLHWAAFILPNLFLGIGPIVFETTSLEFISAQSPYFMKGLLVGIYYALKGLSQFTTSFIIIPLSLKYFCGVPDV